MLAARPGAAPHCRAGADPGAGASAAVAAAARRPQLPRAPLAPPPSLSLARAGNGVPRGALLVAAAKKKGGKGGGGGGGAPKPSGGGGNGKYKSPGERSGGFL
jgi:hypothetical protein